MSRREGGRRGGGRREGGRSEGGRPGGGFGTPAVVQLVRRGKHWSGEPFFERGGRLVVERDKRLSEGLLALVRTTSAGRGHAKLVRVLGRPDVARDVLEALMLDRGLRRAFPRAVEAVAAAAAAQPD